MDTFKLNTIEEAVADFKEGKFVIVVDDEDRENEGDFITAAEMITPEKVISCFRKEEAYSVHRLPFHVVKNWTYLIRSAPILLS